MTERESEAKRYLAGEPTEQNASFYATPMRPDWIEAITADHVDVPPEIARIPGFDDLTDHDREEVLRFASFLTVAGPAPTPATSEEGTSDA